MGKISILDNPFTSIEDARYIQVDDKTTVQMLVDEQIEPRYLGMLTVFFNDIQLNSDSWDIEIKADDVVYLILRPQGGGGGKNPWRMALGIIVAVSAIKLGGLVGAKFVGGLVTATVGVAGTLALNALFPVKHKSYLSDNTAGTPTYRIGGMQNKANPYGAVPIILGRMRVAPLLMAQGYTENTEDGTGQNYYGVYMWSAHNFVTVSDIRIGEQSLTSYDTDVEVRTELVRNNTLGLYNGSVVSEGKNLELKHDAPLFETTIKPTNSKYMALNIDISFPGGLFSLNNKGETWSATVEIAVRYRSISDSGKGNWINPHVSEVVFDNLRFRLSKYWLNRNSRTYFYLDLKERTIKYAVNYDVKAGEYIHLLWHMRAYLDNWEWEVGPLIYSFEDVRNKEYKENKYFSVINCIEDPNDKDYVYITISYGVMRALGRLFTAANRNALNYTIPIDRISSDKFLPSNSYEVKVWRVTADKTDNNNVIDRSYWDQLKVRWSGRVNEFKGYLTTTELKATASKQLNGQIDTLNGILQSGGRVYYGGSWSHAEIATSNPASLLLEVLQGGGNAKAVDDNKIDWDSFGKFYIHCRDNKFEYNRYHDSTMSLHEVLSDIATAGRAYIGQSEGKYRVYIEEAGKQPAQLFNDENIIKDSFSCTKILAELPHALRCTFLNESNDYESDEAVVYMDGYHRNNATLYETMDFPYITNYKQVYRMAKEYMKAVVLRDETYTFQVSYDILRSKRRDVIQLAHSALMVGLNYGRIERIEGGVIYLYDDLHFDEGKKYCLQVRSEFQKPDLSISYEIKTITVTQTNSANCVKGNTSGIEAGMLYTFAEAGKESINCIITDITMGDNLTATVTAVLYAPEIYSHPDDPIPEHKPNINEANNKPRVPPTPHFVSFNETIGLAGYEAVAVCSINYNIKKSTSVAIAQYELQVKRPNSSMWELLVTNPNNILHIEMKQYEYGRYEFRLRSISDQYVTSAWAYDARNLLGLLRPAGDVKKLTNYFNVDGRSVLTWSAVQDFRQMEYVIRRGDSWARGETIGVVNSTQILVEYSGLYWIKARVVDTKVESVTPARILVEQSDLMVENVIATYEESPKWIGVKDKFDVSGGVITFNASKHFDEGYDGEMIAYYEIPKEHIIKLSSPENCHARADYVLGVATDYNYYEVPDLYRRSNVFSGVDDSLNFNFYAVNNVYEIDSMYGKHSDSYKVTMQVKIDDNNWQNFYSGLNQGQTFKMRLKVEIYDRNIDVGIRSFSYSVDVPDRIETYYNKLITEGKLNLIFNKPFNSPPVVVANIVNAALGDYVVLSPSRKDGVNIEVRNGNNIIKNKTLNIMVQGY